MAMSSGYVGSLPTRSPSVQAARYVYRQESRRLDPGGGSVGNRAPSASRVETAFASLRSESSRTAAALSAGGPRLLSWSQESVEVFPLVGGDRLVRQLSLCARARDQGESGWGVAIAHLDNVAERLVRAAYLVCEGGSESVKEEIRNDPGEPDYGRLIGALRTRARQQSLLTTETA
jgi:hypothetical protein